MKKSQRHRYPSMSSNEDTISARLQSSDESDSDSDSNFSDTPHFTDHGGEEPDPFVSDDEDDGPEAKETSKTPAAGPVGTVSARLPPLQSGRKKRAYTFITRIPNPRPPAKMRRRWTEDIDSVINDIDEVLCCKKLQCFKSCNKTFLRSKMEAIRKMSFESRKVSLNEMKGSNGKFYFDGKPVCNIFLRKAFCYSADIISSIRNGAVKKNQAGESDSFGSEHQSQTSSNSDRRPIQRDAIITSLERMAETSGDKMPDLEEIHLPYFRKRDVYMYFKQEFRILHSSNIKCPSKSYFYSTWKQNCRSIKVRKLGRFAKCSTCEQLRHSISEAVARRDYKNLAIVRRNKSEHNELISKERREYKKKRDKARLQPDEFLSIIVDGADQSAFGLPHFMVKTKDDRGHSLKVRLIGLLEHNHQNKLRLFTLTEEYPTGANHVVEAIHRFLTERVNESSFPRTFYIQVDNCTKENKNRFLFSYIECLIQWKLFDEIVVSFLPVGHTHEDIDQTFSCTSDRLRCNDAVTLSDLHGELRQVYNDKTSVSAMNNVINWSGLCEQEKCLTNLKNFSKFRYFKFFRSENENRTTCMIRVNVTDEWMNINSLSPKRDVHSFIKFTPDLKKTPPLIVKCPEGKSKVTDCIEAAESRITSTDKLDELVALRDRVFKDREEEFHWDLDRCIELNLFGVLRDDDDDGLVEDNVEPHQEVPSARDNQVNTDYRYELNTFIAVKSDASFDSCRFWVAKVNKVHRNNDNIIDRLTVHWFDKDGSGDIFTCRYLPSYNNVKAKRPSKRTPMRDTVSVESVIINFPNLTKQHRLPAAVAQHLRSI